MVKKLIYGVGIKDVDYVVQPTINGKIVSCKIYLTWASMLQRCYNIKYQSRQPTYIGCTVCSDWFMLSNFKQWMDGQDWQDKQLDKDILFKGNKVYSPETCVFVSGYLNKFTTDSGAIRGDYPIGVSWDENRSKFMARCNNPISNKTEHLGRFACPNQAHQAWRKRKHELACQLAELQDDPRVAAALRTRYL